MKRRREGKKWKSKIQNPMLERPVTLVLGLRAGMTKSGLHGCKIKIFHCGRAGLPYDRTGVPIVIDVLDAREYWDYTYRERGMLIESYIRQEFGSGFFEVGLYENCCEIGRYEYNLGGAAPYVHQSKASDHEDSEPEDLFVKLLLSAIDEDES
ncbi:hypothetical protein ACFL6S_18010 [Candidatus Poribacteria bacterium]